MKETLCAEKDKMLATEKLENDFHHHKLMPIITKIIEIENEIFARSTERELICKRNELQSTYNELISRATRTGDKSLESESNALEARSTMSQITKLDFYINGGGTRDIRSPRTYITLALVFAFLLYVIVINVQKMLP